MKDLRFLRPLPNDKLFFLGLCDLVIMASDPQFAKYPELSLAQEVFTAALKGTSSKKLQDGITNYKMAPFYRHIAHPIEGILNSSTASAGQMKPTKTNRRDSLVSSNMVPQKRPSSTLMAWDESLYDRLREDNEKELATIQKEEDEAVEAAGETEIQAARGKRAELYARIGDKVNSSDIYIEQF